MLKGRKYSFPAKSLKLRQKTPKDENNNLEKRPFLWHPNQIVYTFKLKENIRGRLVS